MILSILDNASDILSYILDGITQVFNFLIELPSLLYSLLDIIPSPFKEVILGFFGIIIVYFIAKAVMSIAS